MSGKKWIVSSVVLALLTLSAVVTVMAASPAQEMRSQAKAPQAPLGTAFTYQGQLKRDGQATTDTCNMAFRLYDQAVSGSQVGSAITTTVPISNGLFAARLDFGGAVFGGDGRWLGIRLKCSSDSGYTDLGRHELTAAPYALYANQAPWSNLTGMPDGFADGVDDVAAVVSGTNIFAGDGLTQISGGNSVTMAVYFAGSGGDYGAAISVARSDHAHDSRYYTESELNTSGGGGQVHWDNLSNVPAGFADGADDVGLTAESDPIFGASAANGIGSGDISNWNTAYGWDDHSTQGYLTSYTESDPVWTAASVNYYTQNNMQTSGQSQLHWDNLTNVPTGLNDGDDDTTYSAGTGLDLSGDTFSVVTSIIQQRVSDSCAVGSSIREIRADGTVVCEPHDARPGFSTTLLDSTNVGLSSITIGVDGLALICYRDETNQNLKVAHCNDLACTSATVTTVDSASSGGGMCSIIIGADGLGLISHTDWPLNYDLKVAHCNDIACTSATLTTLDSTGDVGMYSSVIIGADGLGLISYKDVTNHNLKVAHCNDVACTSATLTTLDSAGRVGAYTSITIGWDGFGLISYQDEDNNTLKVAHCNDLTCTSVISTTLDSTGDVGEESSITIGVDGLGLISYWDRGNWDLKVAHCDNIICTNATITTLDSAGATGTYTSITIGADGLGLISYIDWDNWELKVAHCNNVACTSAALTTVDSGSHEHTSVTIGADGMGVISYRDNVNVGLKVVHCSNPFCVPYWRRR